MLMMLFIGVDSDVPEQSVDLLGCEELSLG